MAAADDRGPPGRGGLDHHRLAAARLWATNRHPYLASAVFAAPVLPAPGLGRVVVDRWWRIHADPAVVADAAAADLGGELVHLVGHLLRDHATRADAQHFAEPTELHHWVDAADAEIADDFADLPRLEETVAPDDLHQPVGRLAEEYYRLGSVREGETNDCGSGAHGEPAFWEPPPPDSGEDRDGPGVGVGAEDQELLRREVAARIAEAAAGAVSDSLRRWAADHLQPTVDWRAELGASVRRALAVTAGRGSTTATAAPPDGPPRSMVSSCRRLPVRRPRWRWGATPAPRSATPSSGQALAEVDGLLADPPAPATSASSAVTMHGELGRAGGGRSSGPS